MTASTVSGFGKRGYSSSENERILRNLGEIVGSEHVTNDEETLLTYGGDMTENAPTMPDFVVLPSSVEEVQKVLKFANNEKIAVVPYVGGANVGGLTIPQKGGIILDLKRMNRIVKVDSDSMYAVLEPGVTFGYFKRFLEDNHPDLVYTYPNAPPWTSVMCNALLEGLCDLSYRYGCMADWINGLEVVLPDGNVAKIGSAITTGEHWYTRYPLPDLAGLFIGWQGSTGVVTKISVQLMPRFPFKRNLVLIGQSYKDVIETVKIIARKEIASDMTQITWEVALMLMDQKSPLKRGKTDPVMGSTVILPANSDKELRAKEEVLNEVVKNVNARDRQNVSLLPLEAFGEKIAKAIELPTTLNQLMAFRGGGMTWLGNYCPISSLAQGYEKGEQIMRKHGFDPLIWGKFMRGGHFAACRFLIPFNKSSEKEVESVKEMLNELADMMLGLAAIPYKAPSWAAKKIFDRADKNWVDLLRKIKRTLDPVGIMNPGRWGL